MNKLLIVDTTYPINTRTERFKQSLEYEYEVHTCTWLRKGRDVSLELINYYFFYCGNVGFGDKFKKLLHLPLFCLFVVKTAFKVKPSIIFASHWDSLICAAVVKVIFLGKIKIVYDCLDMPTASSSILHKVLRGIERINLNLVDLTIFASRHFKPLYPKSIRSTVYENYPSKLILNKQTAMPKWFKDSDLEIIKNKKSISWIGVVRYFDILENILKALEGTECFFYVFGDGPDLNKLKDKVKEMGMCNQVFFFGRYSSSDLEFIYGISQLVWAAYPTKDFNALYAISNKYFECSYFNRVPIISVKTKMADGLKNSPNVILVDEYSVSDIRDKVFGFKLQAPYIKYEPDVTWEDKECDFVNYIKREL